MVLNLHNTTITSRWRNSVSLGSAHAPYLTSSAVVEL